MTRNPRFWILMTVFQVAFGLAIFAITRQYYIQDSGNVSDEPKVVAQSESSTLGPSTIEDPAEVARMANESFANKHYDRAAVLYERLLVLGPNDVNTYNNLGLTLHYLGRSNEALDVLEEGVSVDPTYPRIWLTLGRKIASLSRSSRCSAFPSLP